MDDFIGSWDIETWDEESRALALRFQEVGAGRCYIASKVGVGQPIDETKNEIDAIGEEVLGKKEAPDDPSIGDRDINGFYVEFYHQPSIVPQFDELFWHVHPQGVIGRNVFTIDGEIEEVSDWLMTLDQFEEYISQIPRRWIYWAEMVPWEEQDNVIPMMVETSHDPEISDEEKAEIAVLGKAMEAVDPEGVERFAELCNIFGGALRADDATDLEEHLKSGVFITGDDERQLAVEVIAIYKDNPVEQVAEYVPLMISEVVPDMSEYVREVAASEILKVLYKESEED